MNYPNLIYTPPHTQIHCDFWESVKQLRWWYMEPNFNLTCTSPQSRERQDLQQRQPDSALLLWQWWGVLHLRGSQSLSPQLLACTCGVSAQWTAQWLWTACLDYKGEDYGLMTSHELLKCMYLCVYMNRNRNINISHTRTNTHTRTHTRNLN